MTNLAAAEYQALTEALEAATPPCVGDWRFILTRHELDEEDQTELRAVCHTCPVRALCAAYAAKARPPAGMWAGRYYRTGEKPA